jgi:hypothetical protein
LSSWQKSRYHRERELPSNVAVFRIPYFTHF